jgi:hypothetical protein
MEKEPEKLVLELRNEEHDFDESNESDEKVESLTLVIWMFEQVRKPTEGYSPSDFHSAFVLSTTNDEPRSIKEAVDST